MEARAPEIPKLVPRAEAPAAPPPLPGLPDGPSWSMPRSTLAWWRRPLEVLDECHRRYGDMFSYRMAHDGTWVFLSDPEAVKQVFTGDPRLLHAGEANTILLPVLGEHSVLLLDEEPHMAQRKLILPHFHGRRMQRYAEQMSGIATDEIERWPDDRKLAVWPRMQAVTLEVILRAVFGVEAGGRRSELRDELRTLLGQLSDPRRGVFVMILGPERIRRFAPFRRLMGKVNRLIYEEISSRRAVGDLAEREDILSLLLQARHEDGRPMSDRELRDELMTLLLAGHETTATALAWAIELLAHHPESLERLESEVETGGDAYLDAVIKEALRLRPVIALVLRKLMAPMEIGGRLLPAGVRVAPCIYLMHRRPDVYPEPERFRPERFLERPPGTYTWIPFGGGVRRCLGASFAEFEMGIVLRELVRSRRIRPAGPPERAVRRLITNVPSRGAEVIAERR